jgi:hypothetical protein
MWKFDASGYTKFNLAASDLFRTAVVAVTTGATGFLNTIAMGRYFSSVQTMTDGDIAPVALDVNANMRVNAGFYNNAPTITAYTATTSSTQAITTNANRTFLLIQNRDATNFVDIFFSNSGPAVSDGTAYKLTAGQVLKLDAGFIPNTAVYVLANTASCILHIEEGS